MKNTPASLHLPLFRLVFNPSCVMRVEKFVVIVLFLVSFTHASYSQTLGQALNATNLTWTTPFPNPWGVTTVPNQTHDGVRAARSSFVSSPSQTSTLQTTVTGPGKVVYWWYQSGSDFSTLSFTINGVSQTSYTSWGQWKQETLFINSGSQTLRWINAGTPSSGYGYLDEVTYTPGVFAPEIIVQPLVQSQVAGLDRV